MNWTEAQARKVMEGRGVIIPKPKPIISGIRMNKTELKYANDVLNPYLWAKKILSWQFEGMGFRMADRTFYYPDFLVVFPDRFEIHEVKGRPPTDDSLVKFKTCRELFPWFVWRMKQLKKGEWVLIQGDS